MDDVDIAMRELGKFKAKKAKYTPPFEMLSFEELQDAIRLSRATIYRMIDKTNNSFDATFPQPLKIGCKNVWRADEITAWLLSLKRGVAYAENTD